jgi:hypothetical protein
MCAVVVIAASARSRTDLVGFRADPMIWCPDPEGWCGNRSQSFLVTFLGGALG